MLCNINNKKSGIGVKVCAQAPQIPCLLFANDIYYLYKKSPGLPKVKKILDDFCACFGPSINYQKSLIFSPKASRNDINMAKGVFNIHVKDSLGKYLGRPIIFGVKKLAFF